MHLDWWQGLSWAPEPTWGRRREGGGKGFQSSRNRTRKLQGVMELDFRLGRAGVLSRGAGRVSSDVGTEVGEEGRHGGFGRTPRGQGMRPGLGQREVSGRERESLKEAISIFGWPHFSEGLEGRIPLQS